MNMIQFLFRKFLRATVNTPAAAGGARAYNQLFPWCLRCALSPCRVCAPSVPARLSRRVLHLHLSSYLLDAPVWTVALRTHDLLTCDKDQPLSHTMTRRPAVLPQAPQHRQPIRPLADAGGALLPTQYGTVTAIPHKRHRCKPDIRHEKVQPERIAQNDTSQSAAKGRRSDTTRTALAVHGDLPSTSHHLHSK